MDLAFFEHLLHEEEGVELDFKREQYLFEGADEASQSELLKDILAFVNAWRRSTAYIVIGVEEVRGARSNVIGISKHLDDAHLQQFVNSKTQRPVTFSYRRLSICDASIGIIEIPVQDRPVFLTKSFGKVERDRVYLRRGSSTAVARPDEVFKMGTSMGNWGSTSSPHLNLEWGDVDSGRVFASPFPVRSLILEPRLPDDILAEDRSSLSSSFYRMRNPHYSQELIVYAAEHSFFRPLRLRLYNVGEVTGRRIRFVGGVSKSYGIELREGLADLPNRELNYLYSLTDNFTIRRPGEVDTSPELLERDDRWELNIEFGDIRPREKVWTSSSLFVGSRNSASASLEGELLGDNIRHPISCVLEITFDVERRAMGIEDVARFVNASEQD